MAKKIVTKIYSPKKLIPGAVIGKEGMFVAIPDKMKDCIIKVEYQGGTMIIENWLRAEAYRKFPDQWGRGMYTLGYFKWEPFVADYMN